jgi:hypothetical protein
MTDKKVLDDEGNHDKPDKTRFSGMLALFENGRVPCLLTSRASTLRTRWSLSGYPENVAPQDSLVPDWFIRIFAINETPTPSISADVTTLDCDDGLRYWCLLLPEPRAPTAQPHDLDTVLETLAIIAHATPEIDAEIGWDIIELQLQRPLQDIYIRLLSFTAYEIEDTLCKWYAHVLASLLVKTFCQA